MTASPRDPHQNMDQTEADQQSAESDFADERGFFSENLGRKPSLSGRKPAAATDEEAHYLGHRERLRQSPCYRRSAASARRWQPISS
jgi:hypothetical protein